jgi:hypothetical protein
LGLFLRCSVSSVDQTNTNNFPLKWTAPETFQTFEYSELSDVWSWAVIALEIFQKVKKRTKQSKLAPTTNSNLNLFIFLQLFRVIHILEFLIRKCLKELETKH